MWVHITCNQNIHNVRISKHDRFRTFYNILVIYIMLAAADVQRKRVCCRRHSHQWKCVFLWNSTRDPPQQHVCRRRSVWCTRMRVILCITIIICCSSVPNCGTRVPRSVFSISTKAYKHIYYMYNML